MTKRLRDSKRLLGLKLTPDLKWNAYMRAILKGFWPVRCITEKIFEYSVAMPCLYKSQIRPRTVGFGAAQSSLHGFDRVQKRLLGLVGDE